MRRSVAVNMCITVVFYINNQDDRIYAVHSIAVMLCSMPSVLVSGNKSEMRFRTLLAHGQKYDGVVMNNGHHSRAVLHKNI